MKRAKHAVIHSIYRTHMKTPTYCCVIEVVFEGYTLATTVWLESHDEMDAYFKLLTHVEKEYGCGTQAEESQD